MSTFVKKTYPYSTCSKTQNESSHHCLLFKVISYYIAHQLINKKDNFAYIENINVNESIQVSASNFVNERMKELTPDNKGSWQLCDVYSSSSRYFLKQ